MHKRDETDEWQEENGSKNDHALHAELVEECPTPSREESIDTNVRRILKFESQIFAESKSFSALTTHNAVAMVASLSDTSAVVVAGFGIEASTFNDDGGRNCHVTKPNQCGIDPKNIAHRRALENDIIVAKIE